MRPFDPPPYYPAGPGQPLPSRRGKGQKGQGHRGLLSISRGYSLIEVMVVMAVIGVIGAPLTYLFFQLITLPKELTNDLSLNQSAQQIAHWLSKDVRMAQDITAGADPDYVTLTWTDYAEEPAQYYTARYYWVGKSILREVEEGTLAEVQAGTAPVSTTAVARNIPSYGSVTIQIDSREITVQATPGIGSQSAGQQAANIRGVLRPSGDAPAPASPVQYAVWPFDDSTDYTFDGDKVEVTGGLGGLKATFPWWDAGWTRRSKVSLTSAAGDLTDYPVSITVPHDAPMQADFDDVRFIASDHATALDHWLESKTDGVTSTFWVTVPSIPGNPLSDWTYRAPFSIEGSTTALVDHPVRVTVPYNANMRTDFSDVRFVAADASTVLDYWLESKTDGVTADFWVKAPSITAVPLSGWPYRQLIHIEGSSAGAQANYAVQVTIPFAASMQPDFDDIRFTASDGSTLLDHWLQSKTDSASAAFWVEVASIPTTGTDIYIYFGNGSAASASSMANTFAPSTFTDSFTSSLFIDMTASSNISVTGGQVQLNKSNPYTYALRGNSSTAFWQYDVSADSWTAKTSTPSSVGDGGALAFDGSNVYALRGGGNTTFWMYDLASNTWAVRASTPSAISTGGALVSAGSNLYALRGANTTDFYRYDIAGNTWSSLAALPATIGAGGIGGGALAYDGTYIYALRGGNSATFYRYDIAGNTWTTLAALPGAVGNGGALVYDGSNIYALRGNNTTSFYRYNIPAGTWGTMTSTPNSVGTGGDGGGSLAYDGSFIYALRGTDQTTYWRYDIAGTSWTTLDTAPARVGDGGALAYTGTYDTPGVLRSVTIPVLASNRVVAATQFSFTDTEPANTDITYQIEYFNGSTWALIPDAAFDGNSTGFDTSPVDVSSLDPTYGQVRLRANLSTTAPTSTTPSIQDWTFTYYYRTYVSPEPAAGSPGTTEDLLTTVYAYYGNAGASSTSSLANAFASGSFTDLFADTTNVDLAASSNVDVGNNQAQLSHASSYTYVLRGNSQTSFYRYDVPANTWASMTSVPATVGNGGALVSDGNAYVYALRGGNQTSFYRYDTASNTWSVMASTPATVSTGGALLHANGALYALRGNNSSVFWRYDIAANTWTALASTPAAVGGADGGAALAYNGTSIYALRGTETTAFWRYDIAANSWSTLTSTPANIGPGGALLHVSGHLYALRGSLTNDFYRYTVATNSWTSLATTPGNVGSNSNGGGSLAYDLTYIYATQGNNNTAYWRYDLTANAWSALAAAPGGISNGGAQANVVTYNTSGTLRSVSIPTDTATRVASGVQITFSGSLPSGTAVSYQLEYWTGGAWALVPDAALSGNSSGFTTSPISISELGPTYGQVRLRANLSTTSANSTPVVTQWTTTYYYRPYVSPESSVDGPGSEVPLETDLYVYYASASASSASSTSGVFASGSFTDSFTNATLVNGADSSNITGPSQGIGVTTLSESINYLYALAGNTTTAFWRYDASAGSWSTLASTPSTVGAGGDIASDGTDLYAFRGASTTTFWKYAVASNSWSVLTAAPATVSAGGSLVSDGTYVYGSRGGSTATFWRYNIAANTWSAMTSAPAGLGDGASLLYDGTDIYALRGNNTTAFWRYDINSNTWTTLASTPTAVTTGGALAQDGTYLYALPGGTSSVLRYDKGANSWSTLPTTPVTTGAGASLAFDGARIDGLIGGGSSSFGYFDPATNAINVLSSAPGNAGAGSGLVWVRRYELSGTLRSVAVPTTAGTALGAGLQLSFTDAKPTGTSITYQVEYQAGAVWALVPDSALPGNSSGFSTSPVDVSGIGPGYPTIRLRANLSSTSDQATPSVQDWTVTYYYRTSVTPEPGAGAPGPVETLFATDSPTVEGAVSTAVSATSVVAFYEASSALGSTVQYVISTDGGETWLWWNGASWEASNDTYDQSNTGVVISANIGTLEGGSFLFKAFLPSDGAQQTSVNSIRIAYYP